MTELVTPKEIRELLEAQRLSMIEAHRWALIDFDVAPKKTVVKTEQSNTEDLHQGAEENHNPT